MFTRDRSGTDPVRFSDRIGLLFTRDRSGTGPERIQNWTCKTAGPVLDPFRTGSRTVPCKQKPIRSGSVRNGSGPVPCKRSLSFSNSLFLYKLSYQHDTLFAQALHKACWIQHDNCSKNLNECFPRPLKGYPPFLFCCWTGDLCNSPDSTRFDSYRSEVY